MVLPARGAELPGRPALLAGAAQAVRWASPGKEPVEAAHVPPSPCRTAHARPHAHIPSPRAHAAGHPYLPLSTVSAPSEPRSTSKTLMLVSSLPQQNLRSDGAQLTELRACMRPPRHMQASMHGVCGARHHHRTAERAAC